MRKYKWGTEHMKTLETMDKSYYKQGHKQTLVNIFKDDETHETQEMKVKSWVSKLLKADEKYICNIERLGGRTNKSFKVTVHNEEFVVRFPGKGTDEFIDRNNEKYNAQIAYDLGLDSETMYFDSKTGFKICRYIKGAETLNKGSGKEIDNIRLMAEGLRTLHCSHKVFKSDFNPFKSISFYERALEEVIGEVSQEYKKVKAQCMALETKLKKLGIHKVPCHIDPLPENFIKVGQDRIYVIDWEYSGNYDAVWDLAAVCLECNFTKVEEEELLKSYFKGINIEEEKAICEKISIYKIVQDMFWCTWAAAKAARGDDYLIEYSKFKFERVQQMLKEK